MAFNEQQLQPFGAPDTQDAYVVTAQLQQGHEAGLDWGERVIIHPRTVGAQAYGATKVMELIGGTDNHPGRGDHSYGAAEREMRRKMTAGLL